MKILKQEYKKAEDLLKSFSRGNEVNLNLSHPCINQVIDCGVENGEYYSVSEHCDGKNIHEYLSKVKAINRMFPIEISVHLISLACQGLNYAHSFRDKFTGISLNIIHKDITPYNIMICYDGYIKIANFTIAESTKDPETTRPGPLKGRLQYIQVNGPRGGKVLCFEDDSVAVPGFYLYADAI